MSGTDLLAVTLCGGLPTAQNIFGYASCFDRGIVLARDVIFRDLCAEPGHPDGDRRAAALTSPLTCAETEPRRIGPVRRGTRQRSVATLIRSSTATTAMSPRRSVRSTVVPVRASSSSRDGAGWP